MTKLSSSNQNIITRSPVVVVMGHVDHGKTTLLDYIKKTNIADSEIGGITQKVSAYEFEHSTPDGKKSKITFIDTPGHEAFTKLRSRGAKVADVAVLVVSAEDGVKPQTLDALQAIKKSEIPFVVAINKIDKPNADINRTKQSLAENEIFVEGWGGDIPALPISAKTGQGVNELLDIVLLTAEVADLTGDTSLPATGVVLEAHHNKNTGISATLIIKNGTIKTGDFVIAENAYSTIRAIGDWQNKKIISASFSSPVKITGWNEQPPVGAEFHLVADKREAEKSVKDFSLLQRELKFSNTNKVEENIVYIPLIVKTNAVGTIDAVLHEIKKIETDKVKAVIVNSGVGNITENDTKMAQSKVDTIILGFDTQTDQQAQAMIDRDSLIVKNFSIIYELADYLKDVFENARPREKVEIIKAKIKILKNFSNQKYQVLGARVVDGEIHIKDEVRIIRGENNLGNGKIVELQHNKQKTGIVEAGKEFGMSFESQIEVAPGDFLEKVEIVEQ